MKILLVSPCEKDEIRPDQFTIPQLTLSLIAAMTPPEHEVHICEEVFGDIINFNGDYDLIGISIMSQTSLRGYEIANEFKKRDKTVVFGGIHASVRPTEALMYGDAVVIGEAEGGLWEEVLIDAKKKKLKPFYKLQSLPDLQNHVFPKRDLIKCSSGKLQLAPIETTRGCPYNCDFCAVTKFFGKKQRHKKIRDIIIDAESCSEKNLFFIDDNITLDRKFAIELFTELAHLNKKWVGQASINISKDKELMAIARKSGCVGLLIGFESMTDVGLNSYRKTLKTVNENVQAVKVLRDNGILVMASMIFGLDSDTKDVFDISYEFLVKSKIAFFQACVLTPYPGTLIFDRFKSEGRILTDEWSKFDTKKVVISPQKMTSEELLKGYDQIRKSVYSYNSILKRSLPYTFKGFTEFSLFFSLNMGARKRFIDDCNEQVYKNPDNLPVDFDISKYRKPFIEPKEIVFENETNFDKAIITHSGPYSC